MNTCIEPLESRIAPATVSVTQSGSTLVISALSQSSAANVLVFQTGSHSFAVIDDGGPQLDFSAVKSIQMNLSDVGDFCAIGFSGPRFNGPLKINSNGGADTLHFAGTGTCTGNVTVNSTGVPAVLVNSNARLTGALQVNAVNAGIVSIEGQVGALKTTGVTIVDAMPGSVCESISVAAPLNGSALDLDFSGIVAGAVSVKGGIGSDSVSLAGRIDGKVTLALGEGANAVTAAAVLGSALLVKTGAGGDSVTVSPDSGADPFETGIAGVLNLSLGDGDNVVNLNGTEAYGGGVKIVTGIGNDNVSLQGMLMVGGSTQANLGAGTNSFTVNGGWLFGGLRYMGLDGNDSINILATHVRGTTNLLLGEGQNSAFVNGSFDNTFRVQGGASNDDVTIGGATINAKAYFSMGDGSNQLQIMASNLRNGMTYIGGDIGLDSLNFESDTLSGAIAINPGDGVNVVNLQSSYSLSRLSYVGGIDTDIFSLNASSDLQSSMLQANIVLGAGDDTATVTTSAFRILKIDGGLGNDTLNRTVDADAAGILAKNVEALAFV